MAGLSASTSEAVHRSGAGRWAVTYGRDGTKGIEDRSPSVHKPGRD